MVNRMFFFPIVAGLAYGFWVSSEFLVVAAGVAIFLFGMVYLEDGFKMFTGSVLEKRLRYATGSLWKSIFFGVTSTAVLQSSSLVSVIVISFLSAGLISLTAGVGIILGSNVGSTTGAWLIALYGMKINLSVYAMPLLVFGLLFNMRSSPNLRGMGMILLAVGFIFLGIDYMKEGFLDLQQSIDFSRYGMEGLKGLLTYTALGLIATAIMQSTNAVLVLVFSALALSQISYDNAIAISIGSNIGTTATAMLGAIRANSQGKRLAVAHLIFNMGTALLALIFFKPLLSLIDFIANALYFIDTSDKAVKLALFHSVFNVLGVLTILPFMNKLIAYLNGLFTQRKLHISSISDDQVDRAKFLNLAVIEYPDAALKALTKECIRLYRNSSEVLCYGIFLTREALREAGNVEELVNTWQRDKQPLSVKGMYRKKIKGVYGDIIKYSGVLEGRINRMQAQELFSLKLSCRSFVRAIKNIQLVYKNVEEYIDSENIEIKFQYNQLRLCLANVLRSLDVLLKSVNVLGARYKYAQIESRVEKMKYVLCEQDRLVHSTLNVLVNAKSVDENMAGSLLNDSAHMHDACNCLIDGVVNMICRDQDEY